MIGQVVRGVAKLVVPQANHTSTGKRKFRIVSGADRFAPLPKARDVAGADGYNRIRKHELSRQ